MQLTIWKCSQSAAFGLFAACLLLFLFLGALAWAKGRDPFQRVWFKVKATATGKAQCIAVLPKTTARPLPVVVYLHGSGESLLTSGNELRQMAEMGLAAVGMEYEGKAESGKQKAEIERPGAGGAGEATEDGFDAQFSALLNYVGRQPWADTNRMAWVGYSLGAQRMLSFALRHPAGQPQLLVLLAGGWVRELESKVQGPKSKAAASGSEPSTLNSQPSTSLLEQFKVQGSGFKVQSSLTRPSTLNSLSRRLVWPKSDEGRSQPQADQPLVTLKSDGGGSTAVLLVHGERDEVFPLSEAQQVAACLETNGVAVELKVLAGEGHSLGANRLLVFRVVGEQCLTRLAGSGALANYRSILSWQAQARPLWLFWTPAFVWGCFWLWLRRKVGKVGQVSRLPPGRASVPASPLLRSRPARPPEFPQLQGVAVLVGPGGTPALLWLAAILAAAALAQTALHLVPPHLPTGERTLSIARKHLVQAKEVSDFEFLAGEPVWRGKPLKTLLEHAELAHYNRELINWKLNEQVYRQFVLSAQIDPEADGELDWRRPLWENFYPRIRREQDPTAAAETVVRFLRERVTIAEGSGLPSILAEIWQRQITDERGFEALYVAALRSVGVPSRLGPQGRAEFWTGAAWQASPRPLVEGWYRGAP